MVFLQLYSCRGNAQKASGVREGQEDVLPRNEKYVLAIVGDIMVHGPQIDAAKTLEGGYDFSRSFDFVRPLLRSADMTIGNLETTFAGKPYSGYPMFSSPDELGVALFDAGFDVLTTSNNHTADRSSIGIARTLRVLDSLGIAHTGSGVDTSERDRVTPLICELGSFRIAIFAYTYGTNGISVPESCWVDPIDTTLIANDLSRADSLGVDYKLVQIHWGNEYQTQPNIEQRSLARWLHLHGVDAVIGSHPHVVQKSEWLQEANKPTFVVYSMGNFISNQGDPVATRGGLILTLELKVESYQNKVTTVAKPSYQYVFVNKQLKTGEKIYRLLPVELSDSIKNADSILPLTEQKELRAFRKYYESVALVD